MTKLEPLDSNQIILQLEQIVAELQAKVVARQETLHKLSRAIEAAPISIVITDCEGRVEYANPFFTELTGYTSEEVIGKNPRILKSELTSPETYAELWSTILKGLTWSGEFVNRKKNGDLYLEKAWIAPVADERDQITHFVAIKVDITRQRQAEETLERTNRTLRALHQVTLTINATSQGTRLLKLVMDSAIELLDANQGGAIYLYNENQMKLQMVEGAGINQVLIGQYLLPGQGLAGKVFEKAQAMLIKDYGNWEGRFIPSGSQVPGSAIGVPLIVNEQAIGVLTLFTDKKFRTFTLEEMNIAEMFAAQAALAYQRIRSYERLERELIERKKLEAQEHELRALAQLMVDITSILNASLRIDDVFDHILTNIPRIAPGDAVALLIVKEKFARSVRSRATDPQLSAFLSTWKIKYKEHPLFSSLVTQKRPIILTEIQDYRFQLPSQMSQILSFLGAPIVVRGELIGLIFIGSKLANAYQEEHLRRLQAFSNQASLAIYNARLYEEVQSLAITDPLTGVYNRRGFLRFGRQEINRAMRFGRPLSMLFFDIDHFKIFNDRYSYAIGDKVLQNVAKVAQSSVRNVDLVGRYGGEEFVALIPEVSKESAVLVAERLRLRVETLRLATDYGELGITISVGVASITFTKYQTKPLDIDEEEELEKLIHRAGKMLRQAKESGRNRVCVEQDQGDGDWTLK